MGRGLQRRDGMMFKYCKKCVDMRQFHSVGVLEERKTKHYSRNVNVCDVCGAEG